MISHCQSHSHGLAIIQPDKPVYKLLLLFSLVAAAAIQIYVIGDPDIVLGVVGEWQWSRHEFAEPLWIAVGQFLPALFGMVFLYYVAAVGSSRLFQHNARCVGDFERQRTGPPTQVTFIFLCGLIVASWCWMKTCERSAPAFHRNLKSMWVLYDPSSSGYFYEAAFKIDSTSEFLATYHDRMLEGDVLHVGTHPPGLFLLNQFALDVMDAFPGLARPLSWIMIRGDIEIFREIEADAGLARRLTDNELSALFLTSELTTLAAALTVIPLFYTIRCAFNAVIAWRTACLWATFPCLVVFLPKSDVLFTFTSMSAVCLGIHAYSPTASLGRRFVQAIGSGLVLWLGLMLSLAHLPVVALLGSVCLIRIVRQAMRKNGARSTIPASIASLLMMQITILATIVCATYGFSELTHCNMLDVWQQNLTNHAGFYDQSPRTYSQWLMINPVELGFSIGLPAALICVVGLFMAIFTCRNGSSAPHETLGVDLSFAVVLTIGALWISGRNSGEAARLWCFLTPWLLVLAAHVFRSERNSDGLANSATIWKTLLFVQIIVCALTSARVSGFAFSPTLIPVS